MDEPAARKIHVRLTLDMHRRLRIRCAELDVTIQDYVVRLLAQTLGAETEDNHETIPMARKR